MLLKNTFFFPKALNILRIIALGIDKHVHTTFEIRGKNIKTTFSAFVLSLCGVGSKETGTSG